MIVTDMMIGTSSDELVTYPANTNEWGSQGISTLQNSSKRLQYTLMSAATVANHRVQLLAKVGHGSRLGWVGL